MRHLKEKHKDLFNTNYVKVQSKLVKASPLSRDVDSQDGIAYVKNSTVSKLGCLYSGLATCIEIQIPK